MHIDLNTKAQAKDTWKPEIPQHTFMSQHFLYLQQLAFVRVRWLDVSFGQFIDLPPQVRVLLAERLHLVGQLVVGSHSVGHVHAVQRLLQESRGGVISLLDSHTIWLTNRTETSGSQTTSPTTDNMSTNCRNLQNKILQIQKEAVYVLRLHVSTEANHAGISSPGCMNVSISKRYRIEA